MKQTKDFTKTLTHRSQSNVYRIAKMCLVDGIRTATKIKENVGVFQRDSLSTEPFMLIQSSAQNTYLIYSVCRLLLKIHCSNILNTLFINKAVVYLAPRALVTYNYRIFVMALLYYRKTRCFFVQCVQTLQSNVIYKALPGVTGNKGIFFQGN